MGSTEAGVVYNSLPGSSISSVGLDGLGAASAAFLVPTEVAGRAGASQVNINEVSSSGFERCMVIGGEGLRGLVCLLGAIGALCGACCCRGVSSVGASYAQSVAVEDIAWPQLVSRAEGPVSLGHGGDNDSGARVVSYVSGGHKYGVRRASCGSRCSSDGTIGSGRVGAISALGSRNGRCVRDDVGDPKPSRHQ